MDEQLTKEISIKMASNVSKDNEPPETYDSSILLEIGKKLYLNPKISDVKFVVASSDASSKTIPAHKCLLAAASDVFDVMFYGNLKETGDVTVSDVSAAAFEEFLQFFYITQIVLTRKNVAEVMHLGHKYNVPKCFEECVKFLRNTLTPDNVCISLGLASLYGQTELMKFCEKFITLNTNAVFKSTGFLNCDQQVLAHILKMDLLSCTEIEVFEACLSWVKTKSGQDALAKEIVSEHLGDLFKNIRFASMTSQQFANVYNRHESLFTSAEYIDINQMVNLHSYQPKIFNRNSRQAQWDQEAVIKCNRIVSNEWTKLVESFDPSGMWLKSVEKSTFTANEPLLLGSFTCAQWGVYDDDGYEQLESNLPVEVAIVEVINMTDVKVLPKVLSKLKASLPSKAEKAILLPKPVLIRPGFRYEIQISLTPENHCFELKNLSTEVKIAADITIQFHNDRKCQNGTVGLITELEFNRI